ncbi:MAG: Transcriptional activator protein CopR [Bacteroidetes bacterium ADurb.Bin408]|nr:MAG: Transcriptional activator protein CopR [Bacteroidetes bacterium ADurb.Bin408]
MKILLVEDEQKVATVIKKGLEENGYEVDLATDGKAAKAKLLKQMYPLVILDILLPGIDGITLCKFIKTKNTDTKVIMLTALGTLDDKLRGFDSGADDYLPKPFEFLELLARIKSLLNRSLLNESKNKILKIADLELHTDSKTAIRNGKRIDLTAKEYALLEYLILNKGVVVSRADIAEKVWDITFDTGTNVIDVYINFLRKKIDKDHPVKLLHTLIGMGYILKDGH